MEYSIHRALAELKLLEKRIGKETQKTFIGYGIGTASPTGFKSKKELEDRAKASFKSVEDLIARRNEFKDKIVESNAKVEVKIAGKKYKVAEAINRKVGIEFEETLLAEMKSQYQRQMNQFEREVTRFQEGLTAYVQKNVEGLSEAEVGKDRKEMFEETYRRVNEPYLVDPIGLSAKIEEKEKEIEDFKSEVDYVLSESNAVTKIKIKD